MNRPVRGNYQITYTYADHEKWRNDHPGIAYNPGIDFYSDDRNIYACDAGVVEKNGVDAKGYGNYLKLKHSWGYSIYAHLARMTTFPVGFEVPEGMIIGEMGYTGNVFPAGVAGTHLHFETRDLNNKPFEPTFEYTLPSNTEQKPTIDTGAQYVRIIADSVAVRFEPMGRLLHYAKKGDTFLNGNEVNIVNGYECQKVYLPFWIAKNDGHEQLLEDA
jgi:murein DD-endopeptidase MepM/ murein hydrolase activator NlpD